VVDLEFAVVLLSDLDDNIGISGGLSLLALPLSLQSKVNVALGLGRETQLKVNGVIC